MRFLLDTRPLIWWAGGAVELSPSARRAIEHPDAEVFVSAASIWEAEIKRALGKLDIDVEPVDEVERSGFRPLPIRLEDALAAGRLPLHHRDPFDRMLVAQARRRGLTLVTRDARLSVYGVATLRA